MECRTATCRNLVLASADPQISMTYCAIRPECLDARADEQRAQTAERESGSKQITSCLACGSTDIAVRDNGAPAELATVDCAECEASHYQHWGA